MATSTRKREHASDGAATLKQGIHDVGTAARQMAADRMEEMRDRAGHFVDEGRERIRNAADTVQSRVQDRPVKSLLIAAGIGFLLGAWWMRR